MSVSLYAATVPTFLQTLGSVAGLLQSAEVYCDEMDIAEAHVIGARLAEDMLPFGYQIRSVVAHSAGAIEAVVRGVFVPSLGPWPESFAGLRDIVEGARSYLNGVEATGLDGLEGGDVRIEMGTMRRDFIAQDFLFSFSQPNFQFHASMAYAILRTRGLGIGKRDYLGALRLKP